MKTLLTFLTVLAISIQAIAQVTFTGKAIDDYTKLRQMITTGFFDPTKINPADYDIPALNAFVTNKSGGAVAPAATSASVSGLGDIVNPTFAIDALGTFVAGRIKEEANIAYLNRFTDFINNDSNIELKLLLPHTKTKLGEVKNEIYDYKNYFPSLRNQFKSDFDNFPSNLVTLFEDPNTFQSVFWNTKVINNQNKAYFAFIFDIINNCTENEKPLKFLENVRKRNYFTTLVANGAGIGNEKELIFLITDLAFHSSSTNTVTKLSSVVDSDDPLKLECFAKLLLASKKNNASVLKTSTLTLDQLTKELLKPLIGLSNSGKEAPIIIGHLTELAKSVSNIIPGSNVKFLVGPSQLVNGIKTKDYSLAVTGFISLINDWVINSNSSNKKEVEKLKKHLTFIVNIINAKDGNDMLAALQAAALPVRSYQMKRNNTFTWTVGALGGISYRSITNNAGIYAPIGIDFAFGGLGFRKGGNVSISFPLIDVSAVTALRLLGNKDVLPELVWKNVFAPGIFFNWGIRNQPITLSAGFQNGPGLIEITGNQAVIADRKGTFILGASFDIPIFKILAKK